MLISTGFSSSELFSLLSRGDMARGDIAISFLDSLFGDDCDFYLFGLHFFRVLLPEFDYGVTTCSVLIGGVICSPVYPLPGCSVICSSIIF